MKLSLLQTCQQICIDWILLYDNTFSNHDSVEIHRIFVQILHRFVRLAAPWDPFCGFHDVTGGVKKGDA